LDIERNLKGMKKDFGKKINRVKNQNMDLWKDMKFKQRDSITYEEAD
jgi:hypothetical protein